MKAGQWLTRRRWLAGALAGSGVVACYGLFKWFYGDPKEITLAVLRRRLGHLRVSDDTLDRFAEDYAGWKDRAGLLSRLSVVALPLRVFSPYELLEPGASLRRLEDSVVSQFLLSTDFFLYGADEGRELQYLSFYDPMTAVCRNPFYEPVKE